MSSSSSKYKSRHRSRSRSPKRPKDRDNLDNQQDWKNVRIKEEPASEDDSSRRNRKNEDDSSRSGRRSHVIHEFESEGHGRRSYYENRSHSRHNDHGSRGRDRNSGGGDRNRRDRDNSRSSSGNQNRLEKTHIKSEPRSRSRSPPGQSGRNHRIVEPSNSRRERSRFDNGPERDRPGQAPPQSDPVRERDWDNFFNPNSEMSRTAVVKREQEEAERKVAIQETGENDASKKEKEKEKPNFGLSGKLTEDTNSFRGVVIKYSEPPEARKPLRIRWRLYPFKDQEALPTMYIHRQSAYLLGRERKIADIPIDHPSCSKQHAVIQFRLMPYVRPDGSKGRRIKPYVLDLESSNGTYVNGDRIEPKRYVELFEKDVLKFGYSSREYVLLHEHSKDEPDDDTPGSSPENNKD